MAKNIVICSDGTWNTWESGNEKNTNVARLWEALIDNEGQGQVTFYDPGVGTGIAKYIGGATGLGISQNIRDCYSALIKHFSAGDRIYLFGFSRGAYTVRSLAGLIYGCGVLKQHDEELIKAAYSHYRDQDKARQAAFKTQYSTDASVKMIGVWDTVGALGIPLNWINHLNPFFHKFHDTKLNKRIECGYHALAIDEQRKTFEPTLWDESNAVEGQTIEQVWFPGVHSDVGGGHAERGLADVSLNWMVVKAQENGLLIKSEHPVGIKPNHDGYMHDSRAGIKRLYRKKMRTIIPGKETWIHTSTEARANSDRCLPDQVYAPSNVIEPQRLAKRYSVATSVLMPGEAELDPAA